MEKLSLRKASLHNMHLDGKGRVRLDYVIPTRGLIGFHNDFLTSTSGTGLIYHVFDHFGPKINEKIAGRINGVLIANALGEARAYALWNLQERGRLTISPQTPVYEGMVVGIHSRKQRPRCECV